MNFIPKNKKFNKIFKLRFKKNLIEYKTIDLFYGTYGLKALSYGCLTNKHYSILKLVIKRLLKKKGKFWFRKYPYTFMTKKPLEVRMGSGKGSLSEWICPIKIGQILLEFDFSLKLTTLQKFKILRRCSQRLPVKSEIITRKLKSSNGFNIKLNLK